MIITVALEEAKGVLEAGPRGIVGALSIGIRAGLALKEGQELSFFYPDGFMPNLQPVLVFFTWICYRWCQFHLRRECTQGHLVIGWVIYSDGFGRSEHPEV